MLKGIAKRLQSVTLSLALGMCIISSAYAVVNENHFHMVVRRNEVKECFAQPDGDHSPSKQFHVTCLVPKVIEDMKIDECRAGRSATYEGAYIDMPSFCAADEYARRKAQAKAKGIASDFDPKHISVDDAYIERHRAEGAEISKQMERNMEEMERRMQEQRRQEQMRRSSSSSPTSKYSCGGCALK